MKTLFILVFSVFANWHQLHRLQWTILHTTLLPENLEEKLEEMSENHSENMYYKYFRADSSRLFNVSQ